MIAGPSRERKRKDEGKGKTLDRDYVVKYNSILRRSEFFFFLKTKKERFSCGSQVSLLICGNMNQEAEEGKEIQTQCLDDQILEDKRMSPEEVHTT